MSDLPPEWQQKQAALISEQMTRTAAARGKTKRTPLGRSVLVEFRSPSSLITLTSNTDKRCFVLALGPKAAEKSGLKVGDEVLLNPEARCLKVEMICSDAVDEYLCSDYAQIVLVVQREA